MLLAESAGRWLEPRGNSWPRGMTVTERVSRPVPTEPGLQAGFTFCLETLTWSGNQERLIMSFPEVGDFQGGRAPLIEVPFSRCTPCVPPLRGIAHSDACALASRRIAAMCTEHAPTAPS